MTRKQRTAMARIISDMIKADNIIEESEIRDMNSTFADNMYTIKEICSGINLDMKNGINRKQFAFAFTIVVLLLSLDANLTSVGSFLEQFAVGIILVVLFGNILVVLYNCLINLHFIGALLLSYVYNLETYPTDGILFGLYPTYVNLLQGIDICMPLTIATMTYFGICMLRCRNMNVKWWWSFVPLYSPIALLFKGSS